jgi:hypothetical protein
VNLDLIFPDKRGSNQTWDWMYYRLSSVGETIQACRVKFPGLEDIEPVIDTPGNVGLPVAYANISKLIKAQWNVDRDRSELIGVRDATHKVADAGRLPAR